jgi:EmrB/QacA subfamily drug resistance transporter
MSQLELQTEAQEPGQQQGVAGRWWALAALAFSLLVISLDITVLNVALPTLARDLKATESQLQWIVDAYTLIYASLVVLGGSLGDHFGRKRMLLLGLLLFGAGSLGSALSGSAATLIAMRGFMGIGGALIMPGTLSLIANLFSDQERPRALGVMQGMAGVGIVIGPLLGGVLLDHFTWGVIFLINVPVVLLAIPVCWWLVPESKDPRAEKGLDLLGALFCISGMFALLYGIIEAPTDGLGNPRILGALVAALLLLCLFVFWELRASHPLLDMRLFQNASFSSAILALALVSLGLTGGLFFLSQYLQLVLGFSPLKAGLCFTPIVIGLFGASVGISPYMDRAIGPKFTVAIGLFMIAGSLALFALLRVDTGYPLIASFFFVLGIGFGIVMVPATNAILGTAPLNKAGVASAASDTAQETGNALGVALLGSILSAAYHAAMDGSALVQALPAPLRAVARESIGGATVLAGQVGGQAGQAILDTAKAAFVQAIAPTVFVAVGIAACGALVALFFMPRRLQKRPAEESKPVPEMVPGLEVEEGTSLV